MENSDWSSAGQAAASQVPQRNVSIAPGSRLLSEDQYKVRRPLFTQHSPILKKTAVKQAQHEPGPKFQAPSVMTSSPNLQTRDGKHSTLTEHSSLGDGSEISSNLSRRPLSSDLQVHRLSTPVRPRLSSPVLHPSYTPLSAQRRTHTNHEQTKSSTYQEEYWACAIPKDPPPRPSGLDPRQDYEALLDYTYPLRPGPQGLDWTLQDSGIEMDFFSSGLSDRNMEHSQDFVLGSSSPDLRGRSFSSRDRVLLDQVAYGKQKNPAISSFSAALITLPWDRGLEEDEDEEFRPLPAQIEQLQQLSLQVRDAAARLQNVYRDPCRSPLVGQDTLEETDGHNTMADVHHLWTKDSVDSLRSVEQHSLMEHISVFCGHLEKLVRWLYAASQKIELLVPPAVDIHSVKSSLAQYQSFQRDVNSHLPLTSSVLQTGRLLLRCIHSTSPVLRDTLFLIENQSRVLERHTEHFFSSILSAMDSLTQPMTEGHHTSSKRDESTAES